MNFNADQIRAIEHATGTDRLTAVSGGAGTGKTTIAKAIGHKLNDAGYTVLFCAPTGKAAARLREATGFSASTIHSMLVYNGMGFSLGEFDAKTAVLCDEASMVDSSLMYEIVKRNPAKLILTGDASQLPPVGPGAPFADLLTLRKNCAVNLEICYRSTAAVCAAGNKIRVGEYPGRVAESGGERWEHVLSPNADAAQETILEMVRAGAIEFADGKDIILVPKNGEQNEDGVYAPCTRHGLNRAIKDIINPAEDGEKWTIGDRIICLKNFSAEDVWNGTTGTIVAIDSEKAIWVQTDTPTLDPNTGEYRDRVLFNREMIYEMDLAYCLSVHKSQGSQYRRVVFAALSRDAHVMLNRQLLYTAVTRTKQNCIVIGDTPAFMSALRSVASRSTVMQQIAAHEVIA
jgi:exodeoxyribonuclease V alpha subunit